MQSLLVVEQKLREYDQKFKMLSDKLDTLLEKQLILGSAIREAFVQCKVVISKLSEEQRDIREDLGEYGGVIMDSTW